ncbi:MAG: carbohydrate kinase [Candidatus Caldatribacteriota bacterium]|nr:carbohydrate kinase [Candidatus Caldatribacteriota bacterium]
MKALSFGEILWDIINDKPYIGGAPFNLAAHLARMGCESTLISSVGKDNLGQRALKEAKKRGIDPALIAVHPDLPTGTVDVSLDKNGHPTYQINENVAWDNIVLNRDLINNLSKTKWEIFCFGTLAQRTRENRKILNNILLSIKPRHIFYDVNLRQNYYRKEWIEKSLCQSSIVKLNNREALVLSELLFNQKLKQKDFFEALIQKYDLSIVCITHGKDGASTYHDGLLEKIPGINGPVSDTVGAGDSFSAGFLFSYLCGSSVYEAAEFAEMVGNFVVSQSGAVPKYPKWLEKEIENLKCKIKNKKGE